MIRLALYISLAILLALGAVWLANNPGTLLLTWQSWEVRTSIAIFCLLAFLYTVAWWYLFKLYRWFKTDNPLMSTKRQDSRRQKGLTELDQGWSALAVEDMAAAIKHGKKAQGYLPHDMAPVRLLIQATSDPKGVYLDQLMAAPHSRLEALSLKFKQAMAGHQLAEGLSLLQKMEELAPDNSWVIRKIFNAHTRLGQWAKGHEGVTRLEKLKVLDAKEKKHFQAVLYHCQAVEADLGNHKTTARDFAQKSLKCDPTFIPAALFLAHYHQAHDDISKAQKVVETAWKLSPHPDLSQLYLRLAPLDSPSEKFRRAQKLARLNEAHPHSVHFLARIALDTEHWSEAKQALDRVITDKQATQESYLLLARLEQLQKGDSDASQAYLDQAKKAPQAALWHCNNCGLPQDKFRAICPDCHSFGSHGA